MTSRRLKRARLAGTLGLVVLCVGLIYGLRRPPGGSPVSIAFLGYTNDHGEAAAVFELTNHSTQRVDFRGEVSGGRPRLNGPVPDGLWAGFSGSLDTHETYTFPLLGMESTSGWRYRAVFSATERRPVWQQRVGCVLDEIGLHFCHNQEGHLSIKIGGGSRSYFSSDRVYYSTNSWVSN